jgi:hypothetical protein
MVTVINCENDIQLFILFYNMEIISIGLSEQPKNNAILKQLKVIGQKKDVINLQINEAEGHWFYSRNAYDLS